MAFPSFAWKYVPSSGVPTPPRWRPPAGPRPEAASGAHSVARHWLKLGSAGRALRAPARRFVRVGVPGYCLQMGPSGSHRRASGVSSRAPTVADVPLDLVPVWVHRRSLLRARVRLPAAQYCCAAARAPFMRALRLNLLHRMEQDYPLNLSISLSGGKETNRDAPSNGE